MEHSNLAPWPLVGTFGKIIQRPQFSITSGASNSQKTLREGHVFLPFVRSRNGVAARGSPRGAHHRATPDAS